MKGDRPMWEYDLETTTDTAADRLWAVIADVQNWPMWHPVVSAVRAASGQRSGTIEVLERGRWLRLTVEECCRPVRFVFTTPLLLARLRTVYEFKPVPTGTRISLMIQILGPLSIFWRRSVAHQAQRSLATVIRRIIEQTRASSPYIELPVGFEETVLHNSGRVPIPPPIGAGAD